jgi:hypothetical protein
MKNRFHFQGIVIVLFAMISFLGTLALGHEMEKGFHLLRCAGYDETFLSEVARTMEYHHAYELYRVDLEKS